MSELEVRNNPEARRYEALLEGKVAGFSEYRLAPDRIIFTHTEVDPALEGRGIGSDLARGALDDARERGLRVTPLCPFIRSFIGRHPAYAELVDRQTGPAGQGG